MKQEIKKTFVRAMVVSAVLVVATGNAIAGSNGGDCLTIYLENGVQKLKKCSKKKDATGGAGSWTTSSEDCGTYLGVSCGSLAKAAE